MAQRACACARPTRTRPAAAVGRPLGRLRASACMRVLDRCGRYRARESRPGVLPRRTSRGMVQGGLSGAALARYQVSRNRVPGGWDDFGTPVGRCECCCEQDSPRLYMRGPSACGTLVTSLASPQTIAVCAWRDNRRCERVGHVSRNPGHRPGVEPTISHKPAHQKTGPGRVYLAL